LNSYRKKAYTLNTGAQIPAIGLGTWQSPPKQVGLAVKTALAAGYRHIDTAEDYQNERDVGKAIRESSIPREEIWVTTKLNNPWHKRVPQGLEKSLKDLGLDYVDLYVSKPEI
jgi:glycerol 2-dehydrogenase (NADP+)